ncbi:MAG: hypothetical protein AAB874_03630 [Patescibacteria group bacterium]
MSIRCQQGWVDCYKQKQALFIHDNNPKRPHPLLTSGNHSDGFFNSRLIISDDDLLRQVAADLVSLCIASFSIGRIDRVVGPQTGATKLAQYISYEVGHRRDQSCPWASPSKKGEGKDKSMVFDDPENTVLRGESVLLCEDVLTTGGSIALTVKVIEKARGGVLPFILVLVNRSGFVEFDGIRVISLIDQYMPIWTPDECPLCKQGSVAIRPKDNWEILNANYD